jgi:hypothetical protein
MKAFFFFFVEEYYKQKILCHNEVILYNASLQLSHEHSAAKTIPKLSPAGFADSSEEISSIPKSVAQYVSDTVGEGSPPDGNKYWE